MTKQRARIYDILALLVAIAIVGLDQWTKALVVANLSPFDTGPRVNVIGQYLVLFYIRNNGAAFSFLANSILLVALIVIAIAVISYLYARMFNTGSLMMKLICGWSIGGALGNIIDRVRHTGYVVDFIAFRIPQIGFYFAIFNIADAAISVGVFLLFISVLVGSFRRPNASTTAAKEQDSPPGNQQRSAPLP